MKPYVNGLIVSDLPSNTLGFYFLFKVKVITAYSTSGIDSPNSNLILLAGVPAKPTTVPARGSGTSDTVIDATITTVT